MQITSSDGREFHVVTEMTPKLIAQLKEYSLNTDDLALLRTSDKKRFGEGSYEEWLKKHRTVFALVSEATGDLAGFIWFGPTTNPIYQDSPYDNWHTAAWRSYNPYRGIGLMGKFLRYAADTYQKMHPTAQIWAGVQYENFPSQFLANVCGFSISGEIKSEAKYVMVRKWPS